jgi:hypothetical protein
MKRVLTILAILLLPLSVWAMTPVTDTDLSNVTGQAGVNINANVSMDIHIGTMAWGDSDGITGIYNPWTVPANSSGGYIGMANFNITDLTVTARMEATDNYNGYNTLMLKPITIDVATTNSAMTVSTTPSWGGGPYVTESLGAGTTFVRFGLGALEISLDSLQFDIGLSPRSSAAATAAIADSNLSQNLGEVTMGEMSIYINPWSYVDIYSADKQSDGGGSSGVRFAVNVTVDQFTLGYISWGDLNGFAPLAVPGTSGQGFANVTATNWMADTAPGFIGLNSLVIGGPIAINGTVAIDINTTSLGIYAQLPALITSLNAGIPSLSIPTGYITSEAMTKAVIAGLGGASNVGLNTLFAELTAYGITPTVVPTTVVHISFPTEFLIDVTGPITAAVELSPNATLTGTGTATLGDIYISKFGLDIHAGSWVDIWAH